MSSAHYPRKQPLEERVRNLIPKCPSLEVREPHFAWLGLLLTPSSKLALRAWKITSVALKVRKFHQISLQYREWFPGFSGIFLKKGLAVLVCTGAAPPRVSTNSGKKWVSHAHAAAQGKDGKGKKGDKGKGKGKGKSDKGKGKVCSWCAIQRSDKPTR